MSNVLGLNTINEGDCLTLMKDIPSKSIDMVLCDLPYGTTQNKWDVVIPFESLWEQYERVTKDNGAIVLTSAQPFTTLLISSNLPMFKYTFVWDKANATGFLNAKKQPLRVTEDVIVFYKKQPTYNPQMVERGKPRKKGGYNKPNGSDNYGNFNALTSYNNVYYPTNLLKITNAKRKGKLHPTQKPTELFEYLLLTYTNEGDTVLDNCIGSGTTAIAAINTKRNYIGIEQDAGYVAIARQRISDVMKTEVSGGGNVD